jgi:predicted amidohydrolase
MKKKTKVSDGKIFNSHIIIDENGEIKQVYDKLHLFEVYLKKENTVMKESDYIAHGQEFNMPIETPIGIIGSLIVCIR